jgi:hypothetical protein
MKENILFDISFREVNTDLLTKFKAVKLEAFVKYLKKADAGFETNIADGNFMNLNHTNKKLASKSLTKL